MRNHQWDLTPQEIADTCESTAALLEGNWARGHWWDEMQGTYCIEGALAAALDLNVTELSDNPDERNLLMSCPVYTAVMETVIERIVATGETESETEYAIRQVEDDGLPWWNDRDERSEDDVLDILHTTAKRVLGVGPDAA